MKTNLNKRKDYFQEYVLDVIAVPFGFYFFLLSWKFFVITKQQIKKPGNVKFITLGIIFSIGFEMI
jgi:hypothetical protein